MKNLILAAMMILFATTANAQKDVTKFLGIPVDGTKAEMIQKLKAKGFTSNAYDSEILEGEFNGEKVNIHIVTDNNKVYRIMVSDQATRDERQIIIRLIHFVVNSSKTLNIHHQIRIKLFLIRRIFI
jgi:hypothetical protein